MKITLLTDKDAKNWNTFMAENFPVVGAFLQTYEWGEFQKTLGRKVNRYFVSNGGAPICAFMLVEHPLPFGFKYLYSPRGPVLARDLKGKQAGEIFETIKSWAHKNFSHFVFVRLEPPIEELPPHTNSNGLVFPPYYIQPRYNLAINLSGKDEDILDSFHSSTRSNMARAKRRLVTVQEILKATVAVEQEFFKMSHDTADRNGGKNIYPGKTYFDSFFVNIPIISDKRDPEKLSLKIYLGLEKGEPAAMHSVLFFGTTATYLYGAGYRASLSSKVTSYLHWQAMQDAKKLGCLYYDLGGIDEDKWPSLTTFKRQFKGEEFSYLGNIDI
ncbi:MAG: peptidoglycan bridge formation glycyltransferase FemA/FemB family protein, partial [Patescibacteria group bacterium]